MKMKKSQLKEAVKAVVRQCLNERLAKEGCGSGSNKRFKGKAGRMFKHVEDSEKEQGKSTKVAKKIAGATVNKKLKEGAVQVGANVMADEVTTDEGMGADSKQTAVEDIIKFVIRRAPAIANDAHKVAAVAAELFAHQTGWGKPDPEHLLPLVQKHMTSGSLGPADECGGMEQECGGMEEAGLTSETGGEGYDEQEEIMLIKVMALIAKKLEAMHAGMPGSGPTDGPDAITVGGGEGGEEPSEPPFGGGEEGGEEEPSAPPFGGGEEEPEEPSEEPEEKPEPEEPAEPKEKKPEKKDKKEKTVKEGSAKTQTQGYRVAPNPSTLTQKTDDEKEKPEDPRLTETDTHMKMGPQYKTVAPRQARVTSDDQARTIQFDPKMTENEDKWIGKAVNPKHKGYCTPMTKSTCTPPRKALAKRFKKGLENENHRVQARSYVTVKDNPNDPNVMRDPENPQSNGA